MTWSRVRSFGLILAANWLLLPITAASGEEWHVRYERAAKNNLTSTRPTPKQALCGIGWSTYLASQAEREALRDLAAAPIDKRLRTLEVILQAAESGENPPLEFAVHAITSGDDRLRQRVIDEVLIPRYRRLKPDDAGGAALFRMFIALERTDVEPGPSVAILKEVIRQPIAQDDRATQFGKFDLLTSIALRAPKAEREAILTLFIVDYGLEIYLPIYLTGLRLWTEKEWESSIRRITQSSAPRQLAEAPLVKMFADGADDQSLLAGLADLNFSLDLRPERRRDMSEKLAAAALRNPPEMWAGRAGKLAELELTADERFELANALKRHRNALAAQYACGALLRKTPPDQAYAVARRFPKLGSEPKRLLPPAIPELFKQVPAEQSKSLVIEWTPLLPEKAFLAGPVIHLAEKIPTEERAELHQKLLAACLSKEHRDEVLARNVLEGLALSADVKPEVVSALITRVYGTDLIQPLNAGRAGMGQLLGQVLNKVTPDFREQCLQKLLTAAKAERTRPLSREVHAVFIALAPSLTPEQQNAVISALAPEIIKDGGPSFESVAVLLDQLPEASRVAWIKTFAEHAAPNGLGLLGAGNVVVDRNVVHSRQLVDFVPHANRLEVFGHFLTHLETNAVPNDWRLRFLDTLLRPMDLSEDGKLSEILRQSLERDPHAVITGTWVTIAPYRRLDTDVTDRMALRVLQKLYASPSQTRDDSDRLRTAVSSLLHRLSPSGRDAVWEEALRAIERRAAWPATTAMEHQEKLASCSSMLQLFRPRGASLPAPYVERLTPLALLLATEAGTSSNNDAMLVGLRGEFSPGFAPRKIKELIARKPDGAADLETLARRGRELAWFAAHAPPQDNDVCFNLLTDLLRDEVASDEKFPKRTLSAAIAECARRRSAADAAPWLAQFLDELKASPKDWYAIRAVGASLQPLGRQNPAAAVEILKEIKNSSVDSFVAEAILEADSSTIYEAIHQQARLDASERNINPYNTFFFRLVSRLKPAKKIACLERFEEGPRLDPKLVQHFTDFNGEDLFRDENLIELTTRLNEPDCVGLRRTITEIVVQRLEQAVQRGM